MNRALGFIAVMILVPTVIDGQTFEDALSWSRQEAELARQELNQGRDKIVEEKLPLVREIQKLRGSLQAQTEALRLLESKRENGGAELQGLRSEHQLTGALAEQVDNQVIRFRQDFELSLAHGERSSYADTLLGLETNQRVERESLLKRAGTQWQLLELSLSRLESLFGGSRFETEGISESGVVEQGEALAYGPVVLFKSNNGAVAGNLLFSYAAILPEIQTLDTSHQSSVEKLFEEGESVIRVDPTLGKATLISDDRITIAEQLKQGGIWMIPIGLFGTFAFLVSILKWFRLRMVSIPDLREFEELQKKQPRKWDKQYGGDSKPLLEKVVAARGRSSKVGAAELDVAYQEFRFNLNQWLPLIALTAAVSPLLGLLGTVTGMIKTFELISLFGAGDAKLLSSGISEALITTEFGLVVAIPALVFHVYLQRRIKKILIQSAGLLEQISPRASA